MNQFFAENEKELIDGLFEMLREYAPDHYAGYAVLAFPQPPAYVYDEGPSSLWYKSQLATDLVANLKDILQENAPDGFYFGNHPDNVREWGYFPIA